MFFNIRLKYYHYGEIRTYRWVKKMLTSMCVVCLSKPLPLSLMVFLQNVSAHNHCFVEMSSRPFIQPLSFSKEGRRASHIYYLYSVSCSVHRRLSITNVLLSVRFPPNQFFKFEQPESSLQIRSIASAWMWLSSFANAMSQASLEFTRHPIVIALF